MFDIFNLVDHLAEEQNRYKHRDDMSDDCLYSAAECQGRHSQHHKHKVYCTHLRYTRYTDKSCRSQTIFGPYFPLHIHFFFFNNGSTRIRKQDQLKLMQCHLHYIFTDIQKYQACVLLKQFSLCAYININYLGTKCNVQVLNTLNITKMFITNHLVC